MENQQIDLKHTGTQNMEQSPFYSCSPLATAGTSVLPASNPIASSHVPTPFSSKPQGRPGRPPRPPPPPNTATPPPNVPARPPCPPPPPNTGTSQPNVPARPPRPPPTPNTATSPPNVPATPPSSFVRPPPPPNTATSPPSWKPQGGPGRHNVPPSSFVRPPPPTDTGTSPPFASPQLSSSAQVPPVRTPVAPLPPVSFGKQMRPQTPLVPVGFPPQSINTIQPGVTVPRPSPVRNLQPSSPPIMSSLPAARETLQWAFQGYPGMQPNVVPQAQPGSSPCVPPQGRNMQHPNYMPPPGAVQGLAVSAPGSFDAGLNSITLPRPLDEDVEPKSLAEIYPVTCSSRYLRFSACAIPNSQSLALRWHLPLGAVVCPLAESPQGEEVPVVDDFATTDPIRCRRCHSYVNPYVTFIDHGRKWRCNICWLLNDVRRDYFAHLDASGRRVDLDKRPELTNGSVEFIVPTNYMVRPPMPPVYFFLIDVSVSAVRSGMLEVVAETIKSSLDNLPGSPRTQIGFITFDRAIHFYDLKSCLNQPRMMTVSDLDDIFVPLPDGLLVNLSESRTVVDSFLDSLSAMFAGNLEVESAFGSALKAASLVMTKIGGKLLIFQNTLPSLGPGRLRRRGDDARVYGTNKEYTLKIPEDPFYKQMAADFSKAQISVNVYAFSDNNYIDVASLGTLSKYSGGQLYHYPNFPSSIGAGDRLKHELSRDLTRETAWEAVMRIRCSRGLKLTSYYGNFMRGSNDLLMLPALDCDKAYAMEFCLEEETLVTTKDRVYFQMALLYTSSSGERRVRVHTAAVPVVTDLGEMYRRADIGAVVSLLSRIAIEKSQWNKLEVARSCVQQTMVKALREYRKIYGIQGGGGGGERLIYPESLKLLPLYALGLIKSAALGGGHGDGACWLDEQCGAGHTMMALPVKRLLKLVYPNLVRVDESLLEEANLDNQSQNNIWKKRLPVAAESLDSRGVYVYDDGFRLVIWFGRMVSADIAVNLLGDDDDSKLTTIVERENETSKRLMRMLRKNRESDQLCEVVRQGEPREAHFNSNLVEDGSVGGTYGYSDWMLQLHRQVRENA